MCLANLWNAKSSLGSIPSQRNDCILIIACKIIAPPYPLSYLTSTFLTHEIITQLSLSENGCQVPLSSAGESSWKLCVCLCVIVLIPTCNCTGEMTACVFVCMHVCKVSVRGQCRDLTQWQALGHPPTSWYVCGTLQLEPLHVTALVPSCPFTRNDWPIWGTQTHIHTQWVTSDVGLLWHFPRASSSVHS